ncbi:hypothetical protein Afil01_64640 [Actinorhabdospora filicis]|uniref:Uncharacterized protein n=1 Tax=Actinorhabdospora filicis TaxID=1785913 RepID=A0A9W6SSS8_9ACTN|nr:hypothetical protein [Actinorhabdospora filicis]GLZ81657.1 hypothetical protein Afil01_64640 [Actinorhabdospora filicis]
MNPADLDENLAREFDSVAPDWSADPGQIVTAGRRRKRGRMMGAAGGGLAGIAAFVAAAVMLTAPGVAPAADDGFPVRLDPDASYMWDEWFHEGDGWPVPEPRTNDTTRAITEAFATQIAALGGRAADDGIEEAVRAQQFLVLSRTAEEIAADESEQPYIPGDGVEGTYSIPGSALPGGAPSDYVKPPLPTPLLQRMIYRAYYRAQVGPDGREDSFRLEYYPAGTFLEGGRNASFGLAPDDTDVRYLAPGCEYREYTGPSGPVRGADYACAEATGPNGERILMVTATTADRDITYNNYTVAVLYLPDGTAIKVGDYAWDWSQDGHTGLTARQLADLLLAMPRVPVQ